MLAKYDIDVPPASISASILDCAMSCRARSILARRSSFVIGRA